jgi:hypothetical protein
MGRIVHACHNVLLVIVLVIDQDRVLAFEQKREPRIAIDPHGSVAFQLALPPMQPPARCIHVTRAGCLQLGADHVFLSGDRAFKRVGGLNVKVLV